MDLKKKLKLFLAICSILLFAALSLAGVYFFKKSTTQRILSGNGFPNNQLKTVLFKTNGKITPRWTADKLKLSKDANLFELDVFLLQQKLQKFSQIKKILIEKHFPDTLFIQLEERRPLMKFLLNFAGKQRLLLIDDLDGQVFAPICYTQEDLMALPFVNIKLEKMPGEGLKFRPFQGVSLIKECINLLTEEFAEVWAAVQFIDLQNYDSRLGADWSKIILHLKNDVTVVLGPKNLNFQLLKLDYLLHRKYDGGMPDIKKIDLSGANGIIIQYK